MNDLTIIYYTANFLDDVKPKFVDHTRKVLVESAGDVPIISVSQKPINLGLNICIGNIGRSHLNIYRQALIGAKEAKTKYIAMAEDDCLYPSEHFIRKRPQDGFFLYNKSIWSIYTWVKPPIFSHKDRRVMVGLICERDLFIEAMEERFSKHPVDDKIDLGLWSEPGKYEKYLGVKEQKTDVFYTDNPIVAFSHETALAFGNLGTRKRLGGLRATAIPLWGNAEEILKLYE